MFSHRILLALADLCSAVLHVQGALTTRGSSLDYSFISSGAWHYEAGSASLSSLL